MVCAKSLQLFFSILCRQPASIISRFSLWGPQTARILFINTTARILYEYFVFTASDHSTYLYGIYQMIDIFCHRYVLLSVFFGIGIFCYRYCLISVFLPLIFCSVDIFLPLVCCAICIYCHWCILPVV